MVGESGDESNKAIFSEPDYILFSKLCRFQALTFSM